MRVPGILATVGAVVLAAMIAREFGGERRAQAVTAVTQATALWPDTAITTAVAAPTLWWQQTHGWPQSQMTRVVAGEAEALHGGHPEPLSGYFGSADKIGTVNDDLDIYLLSRRRQPWQQIWPQLRILTVS